MDKTQQKAYIRFILKAFALGVVLFIIIQIIGYFYLRELSDPNNFNDLKKDPVLFVGPILMLDLVLAAFAGYFGVIKAPYKDLKGVISVGSLWWTTGLFIGLVVGLLSSLYFYISTHQFKGGVNPILIIASMIGSYVAHKINSAETKK